MDARHSSDQVHTKTLETLDDFRLFILPLFANCDFILVVRVASSSMRSFANLRISRVRTHTPHIR